MNRGESEEIYTYHPDQLSVDLWRMVIDACQSYEQQLLDGLTTSADDFASHFPDLPKELLTPELERVRREVQSDCDPTQEVDHEAIAPTKRYLILEEIRSGGMGQVFRAFDRTCGRLVAIKRIRREFADEPRIRQRFLSEVELTADLEHPGVIPIYDQSVDPEGREFYVMRLIHGEGTGTLQQSISTFHEATQDSNQRSKRSWNAVKRSDFRKLIESVLAITDTTAHAHSRGIAHRDLKPSNILVGPFGETLIADWGLAKRINAPGKSLAREEASQSYPPALEGSESRWALYSQGVGTPGFRAPEMLTGSATANLIAADIYSLGAILSCVITGSVLDRLEPDDRILDPSAPTAIRPLMAIARKAMSNDAANRYDSAQSMSMDLSNWLAGEPVQAYPESLAERLWRWPARNRLVASAIAGALLISLIASGLFAWYQTVQKDRLGRALETASVLLEENQQAKKSIEESFSQREALALHAIVEFQSLLTLNPSLQSDPQFRVVREKVLRESRSFYENLANSFDQSAKIDDDSLGRLTDAALALVLLENELGNFSDALRIAESALERLRRVQQPSHRLEYHLGRMLAFKGNIATRNGWKKQGLEDQEQAARHLEPLLDSTELTLGQRGMASSLWSRAASPMALGMASKGEFQSATELLRGILARLNSQQTETFQDALLKIQSYGNLALVLYFSKDTQGTYDALMYAEDAVKRCESLIDEGVPFREIIEFEVMRGTLIRFKSDLMLTEGKVAPAIELQSQSLAQLNRALRKQPGNAEIQTAYHSCNSRLQTVLMEQGRGERAKEVALEELELARQIQRADESDPKTREFLLLAYHSIGHLSEKAQQTSEAEKYYGEALTIAESLLERSPDREILLSHAIELNVHLIRYEITAARTQAAGARFEEAIESARKLKESPNWSELYQSGIKRQMEAALRLLPESELKDRREAWIDRLRASELLP